MDNIFSDDSVSQKESLAVKAHNFQNLYIDKDPKDTSYNQHDDFQNGILRNGQPVTFYAQVTDDELHGIRSGNPNISSFLTDKQTIQSCVDKNGVLDQNALSDKLQINPYVHVDSHKGYNGWYNDENACYRNGVAAFNVNWEKFNASENVDLKERLCNPDGRSPETDDIKMAYGTVEANRQFGEGGGHQYYLDKETFNEAIKRGIIEYNEDESYIGDKCINEPVPIIEAAHGQAIAEDYTRDQLDLYAPNNTSTDLDSAIEVNKLHSDVEKINRYENLTQDFVTIPDPAYEYKDRTNDIQIIISEKNNNDAIDDVNINTVDETSGATDYIFDDGYFREDAYVSNQDMMQESIYFMDNDMSDDGYFREDAYVNGGEIKEPIEKEIL